MLNFLATLFGVLIGIPVALWIDRKTRESVQHKKAEAVLSSLKEEINHNVNLLKQIQKELKPDTMITYNLDMNAWRVTSLQEFEGMISHELLRKIFRIYYEFEHMSRKIDTQFNMHYSVVGATNIYLHERKKIADSILSHASILEKEGEELVKQIEAELRKLSKNQPQNTNSNI